MFTIGKFFSGKGVKLKSTKDSNNEHLVHTLSGGSEGGYIVVDGVAYEVKDAVIDAATSGDNTLVAAVASRKIRVVSLWLIASGAVTIRFESGAGGTALTGQASLAANGGIVLGYNPSGWFKTAVNTLLNLELSGATSVDGSLSYIETP